MLQREGEEVKALKMLFRAVEQAVKLLGSESWLLLEAIEKTAEGVHTYLLRQITGKKAQ